MEDGFPNDDCHNGDIDKDDENDDAYADDDWLMQCLNVAFRTTLTTCIWSEVVVQPGEEASCFLCWPSK